MRLLDTYTRLALFFEGTDGSTTITDSSGTSKTVTAVGNAQINANSCLLDGNGDYLAVTDSSDFHFGTGNFTFSVKLNLAAHPSSGGRIYLWSDGGDLGNDAVSWYLEYNGTGYKMGLYVVSGATTRASYYTGYHSLSLGKHSFALVRSGSTCYMFMDGASKTVTTNTAFNGNIEHAQTATPHISHRWGGSGGYLTGRLYEYVIEKGIARWTAGYTPAEEDSFGIGDSVVVDAMDESFSMADSITMGVTFTDSLSDGVGVSGSITSNATSTDALSDSAGIEDSITMSVESVKYLSDSAGVADLIAGDVFKFLSIAGNIPVLQGKGAASELGWYITHPALIFGVGIAGNIPAFTGLLTFATDRVLNVAGRIPVIDGSLTIGQDKGIDIAGSIPMVSASLSLKVNPLAHISGYIPVIRGTLTMTAGAALAIAGNVPVLTGRITACKDISLAIAGNIPVLTGRLVVPESVWEILALNLKNMGLTTHTGYPFNSLCRFKGKILGAGNDGIYEIDPSYTTDNGTAIAAEIETGLFDLEAEGMRKRVRHAWLGHESSGDLVFTVVLADGTEYAYAVDDVVTTETGIKVQIGKGIKSRYLAFNIKNAAGSSFKLDKLRVFVEPSSVRMR
ncbi:MAG: hypothetical protein A4E65_00804 [Syntrophorhabdus sp. PtaU1.Bin153]|nr:MAG: hypothetical protein A4E65_00804 [Syntrophorhabdus sp. PtaU1.Bin153]